MLGRLFPEGNLVLPSLDIPLLFRLPEEASLRVLPENTEESLQAWRYLSHQVRRKPHDLRNHIRRVLLAKEYALTDQLAGSLLDLFLALGNSGTMLKERMLELCLTQLGEQQTFFRDWIDDNQNETYKNSWMHGSMLATGEKNTTHPLLTPDRVQQSNQYENILAEVQDYLEYGQLDAAQEKLETEILEGRGTPELEQELLIIYQHTRNKDRLIEVADALLAAQAGVTELWSLAREEAQTW